MAVLTDLPLDVIDRVLILLPDFDALSAAIKSCKLVYDVFQSHPKSIVEAIAYNVVGPALKTALAYVRTSSGSPVSDKDLVDVLSISRHEARTLAQNASAVFQLQNLYSLSCKDRSSSTSRLTFDESFRFCRAFYRLWEIFDIFIEGFDEQLDSDDEDEDEDEEVADPIERHFVNVVNIMKKQKDKELLELDAATLFAKDVSVWVCRSSNYYSNRPGAVIPAPDCMIHGFRTGEPGHLLARGFTVSYETWDRAFTEASQFKGISAEKRNTERPRAILDEVVGGQDTCYRCYGLQGVKLWGRSNFVLYRGHRTAVDLCQKLEGLLPRNGLEVSALTTHVTTRNDQGELTFDWSRFFEELCDISVGAEGAWDKDQYYCDGCIEDLLKSRLTRWWLARKRELNLAINDDCWYGYACRTQTHKPAHAAKLNHLCEPTRGDGYLPRGATAGTA